MEPSATSERQKRKLRNWLLQPLVQIRLGMYTLLLAVGFSTSIFVVLMSNLQDFAEILKSIDQVESEILILFQNYLQNTLIWTVFLIGLYLVITLVITIVYTHRLVGPTVAFRNHLERLILGDLSQRVMLRKGDAFGEVAVELNRLTDVLEKNKGHLPNWKKDLAHDLPNP